MDAGIFWGVLLAHVRRELLADFRPDCCIATARAVLRVAGRCGIAAEAVPASLAVFNRMYQTLVVERGELPPTDRAALREWCKQTGAYSVGAVEGGVPGEGFNGHVVVWGDGVLFDGALGQFARPEHGIMLPGAWAGPLAAVDRGRFLAGEALEFPMLNGCVLAYQLNGDDSYLRSPDWTEKGRTDRAVRALLRRVRRAGAVGAGRL
jgi:hypothetical protein